MKIKKITYQHRRDFKAIFRCEECGFEQESWGYDDRNFHDNVVPKIKCGKCGKSTIDLGCEIEYSATKYPEGMQI